MTSPYLTLDESAEYAHCSVETIRRARKNGDLEWVGTPGHKVLIKPEWLDEWLAKRAHRDGNRANGRTNG